MGAWPLSFPFFIDGDAVYILVYSLFGIRDGNLGGPAIKAAPESISRTYYGVVATYERPFSKGGKDAITQNMLVMGMVKNGASPLPTPTMPIAICLCSAGNSARLKLTDRRSQAGLFTNSAGSRTLHH